MLSIRLSESLGHAPDRRQDRLRGVGPGPAEGRSARRRDEVIETCREGRARPDGSLVPADAFVGQGEWADPAPVLMVVEVTSYDSDTDRRDRVEKPRAYAETGRRDEARAARTRLEQLDPKLAARLPAAEPDNR